MTAPVILPPATKTTWTPITLTDVHPVHGAISFTFPRTMLSDPLTAIGVAGSEPDDKAPWWPYFQQRHKTQYPFWVQGHMLNHNVHGEGKPYNLVPISHVLNTNMSAMVEEVVKKLVNAGHILRYEVTAHWEGAWLPGKGFSEAKHCEAMRGVGGLIWGEQFAPTRLSWKLQEYGGKTMAGPLMDVALDSRWRDPSQWNNNFPG